MFNVCKDAAKGHSYYPQNITLQFYICHLKFTMLLECYLKNYATWLFHKKRELTQISGTKPGTDQLRSVGSRILFYHISIMLQIFIKDSGNLKNPKNVKSINNTTVSHLVSCRVIHRPAMQKKIRSWKSKM